MKRKVLYSKKAADFLSDREKKWKPWDQQKIEMILEQTGDVDSFLEIGCGSGQILKELVKRIPHVVGVDESPDRLREAARVCGNAKLIRAKAQGLTFREEFEAVMTSQMLHEVKMFGTQNDVDRILFAVKRALKPGGKYILLDHLDPGEGTVRIEAPAPSEKLLLEFKSRFRFRPVHLVKSGAGRYEISKRDLQDFVTKTWSLNSPMEDIEMNETHASFSQEEAEAMARKAGFLIDRFIPFADIAEDLKLHHVLLEPPALTWNRKFILVASKT
jgi:ubiquinone/menaquinone biosynthesis C-methylase UbiE